MRQAATIELQGQQADIETKTEELRSLNLKSSRPQNLIIKNGKALKWYFYAGIKMSSISGGFL